MNLDFMSVRDLDIKVLNFAIKWSWEGHWEESQVCGLLEGEEAISIG